MLKDEILADRIVLRKMNLNDADFMCALLNTEGFLRFIGDRHVRTVEDAQAYIQKMMDDPQIQYWMIQRREDGAVLGAVTFIQRTYLDYHDIGYALMLEFVGQGYAWEAVVAVLLHILPTYTEPYLLATVLASNEKSISLLRRLGMQFERELLLDEERDLHLYSVKRDDLVARLRPIEQD